MPATTAQAFASFVDLISPSAPQTDEIARKRSKTEEYLREAFPSTGDLPVGSVVLIGSASRNTIVRPVDDIDVMARFDNKEDVFSKYGYRSGEFLQRIRTALNARTSIKKIGARGQAVRLFYTSGAHVDIAPVFSWSSGGFALPDGSGGWLTTDPPAQNEWFSTRKSTVGSGLVPLIKLAKRWNRVHSDRLESYHLEVMVCSMFSSVGSNYRDALKCFFEWAPGHIDVSDPAGHSGLLSSYVTPIARGSLRARFEEAHSRAVRAIAAEGAGDHAEAKRLWRVELGDEFPLS